MNPLTAERWQAVGPTLGSKRSQTARTTKGVHATRHVAVAPALLLLLCLSAEQAMAECIPSVTRNGLDRCDLRWPSWMEVNLAEAPEFGHSFVNTPELGDACVVPDLGYCRLFAAIPVAARCYCEVNYTKYAGIVE